MVNRKKLQENGVKRYYNITGSNKFNYIDIGVDIDGYIVNDIIEWNSINRNNIIQDFKKYLRTFNIRTTNYIGTITSPGPGINTPILRTTNDFCYDIDDFIFDFELAINPSFYIEMDVNRAKNILNKDITDPLSSTSIVKNILKVENNIDGFIHKFECRMQLHDDKPFCPTSLINTKLGYNILNELKSTTYSKNVYCHNALYYKNFVLKNNELIGIIGWEYSGYYPPELEDIIAKYIDKI